MTCKSPLHKSFERPINILAFLWERASVFFSAIGSIGAVFLGLYTSLPGPWDLQKILITILIFLITVIFSIFAPWANHRLKKSFHYYDEEIRNLNTKIDNFKNARNSDIEKMQTIFREIGNQLLEDCNIYNDHTRISLYQHEPKERCFILLERLSKNPSLSQKGRPYYPDDQGFISEVWERNKAEGSINAKDPENWAKRQNKDYNIPLEVAYNIKMKSRSFSGISLINKSKISVGLLIIESTEQKSIPNDVLDRIEGQKSFEQLSLMLSVTPHLPKDYFSKNQ